MKYILIYLLIVNLIGLVMMFSDKERAKRNHYRISERALFLAALLGGSIGVLAGIWLFRHKTRHWYFVVGIPFILLAQAVLAFFIWKTAGFPGPSV